MLILFQGALNSLKRHQLEIDPLILIGNGCDQGWGRFAKVDLTREPLSRTFKKVDKKDDSSSQNEFYTPEI